MNNHCYSSIGPRTKAPSGACNKRVVYFNDNPIKTKSPVAKHRRIILCQEEYSISSDSLSLFPDSSDNPY